MIRHILVPLALAATLLPAAAEDKPPVNVEEIFSGTRTAADQPILLPDGETQVIVSRFEIAPGAALPVHKHPHPRYAYVMAGELRVKSADGALSTDYGPGDFVVEMLDLWHSGSAIGEEPVVLIVIDQVPPGTANTILHQD